MKGKLSLPRSQRLPNHNQKLPMLDPNWFKKTIKKINRLRMLHRRKKKHKNKRKKNRKRPSKIRKIKLWKRLRKRRNLLRRRFKNRKKLRKKQRVSSSIVMTQPVLKLKSALLTIHSLTNQQPKKFKLRTHLAIIKPISLLRTKNKNHQSLLLHNLMNKKIKIRKKIKRIKIVKINLLRLVRITRLLQTLSMKEKRISMSKNSK